ncbi:hypothetical protein GIB67_008280 [Kingdonia uniflora]|uniref:Protein SGT1 homolog n=1 Tax=Kingdonia uniflora TaxID=39325 RepID=A0A7J7N4M0_9MAGN|nr:hypothetical protein GIB67_008280 [Kingdonia uniflora]
MASHLEKKAKEAFVDDNFDLAVDLYTQAISMDSNNADLYSDRAQTNIKLKNYTEAVADANKAIELDPSMAKAYLRKGHSRRICFISSVAYDRIANESGYIAKITALLLIKQRTACIKLEEYETAKVALEAGASLAQGDSRFTNLIKECDDRIAAFTFSYLLMNSSKLSEESGGASTQMTSNSAATVVSPLVGSQLPITTGVVKSAEPALNEPNQATVATPAKPKYRHEFYQKPEEVVFTIYAKGIPAKNVVIDFGEQILSIVIDVPGDNAYHFHPRLFGKIVPEKCKYEVMPTKIEIRLAKAEAIVWTSLEFTREITVLQKINVSSGVDESLWLGMGKLNQSPPLLCESDLAETNMVEHFVFYAFSRLSAELGSVTSHKPSYPSSRTKATDWDKLEAQVKKEEKEEKLDGDAAVNKLFRDIYQDADDDMKRAMSKSYLESNGTVLSTNWKDVGAKKVESTPPDGMEVKKWEY